MCKVVVDWEKGKLLYRNIKYHVNTIFIMPSLPDVNIRSTDNYLIASSLLSIVYSNINFLAPSLHRR